jgi:uncharacterized protein (TIGR02285 family)
MRCRLSLAPFLLLISSLPAQAADSITWITNPLPPTFITEGPDAGMGVGDQQLRLLMSHLPGYDHHRQQSSFARIWTQMAGHDGVCAQSVFSSPERRKVAVFNRRPLREAGFRLYGLADNAKRFEPYLTPAHGIDFARLAGESGVRGAYYGTRLLPAPVIAAHLPLETTQSTEQMIRLLTAHRLDFFLAVGNEVSFFHRDDIVGYPIEGVPAYNDVFIACADKAIGRAVIAKIDALLAQPDLWAEFVAPMRRWHAPDEFEQSLISQPLAAQ